MLTHSILSFFDSTQIPQQFKDVDVAIFTNPWFMVPLVALVGWWIYKQAWRDIFILALLMADWYLSGTEYMRTLIVGDQLQINKILPVMFGAAAQLGLIIYLLFVRGD